MKSMKPLQSFMPETRAPYSIIQWQLALLLVVGAGLLLVQPCAGTQITFELTGSLATPRGGHTDTLLADGKVLVAGGTSRGGNSLASAELYDPTSRNWTPTASLATKRSGHTATLLPSGKVLVAGGFRVNALASAELYDPATGTW